MTCPAIKKVEIKQCEYARDLFGEAWQKEDALRLEANQLHQSEPHYAYQLNALYPNPTYLKVMAS